MNDAIEIKVGERYVPEQIVVDLAHRAVVVNLLTDAGFTPLEEESLPALSLALLAVQNLTDGVMRLPQREELLNHLRDERMQLGLPEEPSDLDVLLLHLRREARKRYADWTPVMGKNRDVEAIGGLPHLGGGEGMPRRPTEAFHLPPLPEDQGRVVRVGVLDTGLFPNEELDGRYVTQDFIEDRQPFRPWQGHATFVAGRILSQAPAAELRIRQVLNADGRASSWAVAQGMASFLGSGVEILNMSFGGPTADGSPPLVLERAVNVLSADIVLVAAAGNHGDQDEPTEAPHEVLGTVPTQPNSPLWPAALPNVVAVGATDDKDAIAAFTPRDVPWLDLVARGVDVDSTFLVGDVQAVTVDVDKGKVVRSGFEDLGTFAGAATWSGTSFAAADVTGEIAALARQQAVTAGRALEQIRGRRAGRAAHRPPW